MVPKHMKPVISVKLDDIRCMPKRAHPSDAGADLFSIDVVSIYPGETKMVNTGVSIAIPVGQVGLVYNRSSQGKINVSIPHGVGVIDSDYRGNIKLLLVNNGEDPYFIYPFTTRIGQLVVTPIILPEFTELDGGLWDNTTRGTGGFGSTG